MLAVMGYCQELAAAFFSSMAFWGERKSIVSLNALSLASQLSPYKFGSLLKIRKLLIFNGQYIPLVYAN